MNNGHFYISYTQNLICISFEKTVLTNSHFRSITYHELKMNIGHFWRTLRKESETDKRRHGL